MSEPRLIDANEIVEVAERAWNVWNLAMATQDTNQGINKVLKRQELCKAVKAVAEGAPTIDPENLPIVRQLREELERVTKERNAAIKDLKECAVENYMECNYCKNEIKKYVSEICRNCNDGSNFEHRGEGNRS